MYKVIVISLVCLFAYLFRNYIVRISKSIFDTNRRRRRALDIHVSKGVSQEQSIPENPFAPYPKAFLDLNFSDDVKKDTDKYIGNYDNAGVIFAKDFIQEQYAKTLTIEKPASYTPYIEDYVHMVKRPPLKKFPKY